MTYLTNKYIYISTVEGSKTVGKADREELHENRVPGAGERWRLARFDAARPLFRSLALPERLAKATKKA